MYQQHLRAICFLLTTIYFPTATGQASTFSHGFRNPVQSESQGGNAKCVTGTILVTAAAVNTKLLISDSINQTVITETIQELVQVTPSIVATTNGGSQAVSGTFNITATLCTPKTYQKIPTLEILTHGLGLNRLYWDIAPGFSFVDAAARAGRSTFTYDRIGSGNSSHPDPIQIVQSELEAEILHQITQMLRQGKVGPGSSAFSKFVGIGHSYGSILNIAQAARYPKDVDAHVFTSFSNTTFYNGIVAFGFNPTIASQNVPSRFGGLPDGYVTFNNPISYQLPFFRFPYFDPSVFDTTYKLKDLFSIGQFFTLRDVLTAPASAFTGPVYFITGQEDFVFCGGNCSVPVDQIAAAKQFFFPAAATGSQTYLLPNTGHAINAHYTATREFELVNNFLRSNRL